MERAVEGFVAITALLLGASHGLRPGEWAEAVHRYGRPGALVSGGLCLLPAALILAWPPMAPGAIGCSPAFGWLFVVKASIRFLAPIPALRSMQRGANSPRAFILAGVSLRALAEAAS